MKKNSGDALMKFVKKARKDRLCLAIALKDDRLVELDKVASCLFVSSSFDAHYSHLLKH